MISPVQAQHGFTAGPFAVALAGYDWTLAWSSRPRDFLGVGDVSRKGYVEPDEVDELRHRCSPRPPTRHPSECQTLTDGSPAKLPFVEYMQQPASWIQQEHLDEVPAALQSHGMSDVEESGYKNVLTVSEEECTWELYVHTPPTVSSAGWTPSASCVRPPDSNVVSRRAQVSQASTSNVSRPAIGQFLGTPIRALESQALPRHHWRQGSIRSPSGLRAAKQHAVAQELLLLVGGVPA